MKYRRKHGIIFVTILIGMLLTAGCGKAKESNVTVGNKVPQLDTSTETSKKKIKGSDKKQESEGKTEDLPVSDAERISFRCDTAQNERRISIPPLQVRRALSGG